MDNSKLKKGLGSMKKLKFINYLKAKKPKKTLSKQMTTNTNDLFETKAQNSQTRFNLKLKHRSFLYLKNKWNFDENKEVINNINIKLYGLVLKKKPENLTRSCRLAIEEHKLYHSNLNPNIKDVLSKKSVRDKMSYLFRIYQFAIFRATLSSYKVFKIVNKHFNFYTVLRNDYIEDLLRQKSEDEILKIDFNLKNLKMLSKTKIIKDVSPKELIANRVLLSMEQIGFYKFEPTSFESAYEYKEVIKGLYMFDVSEIRRGRAHRESIEDIKHILDGFVLIDESKSQQRKRKKKAKGSEDGKSKRKMSKQIVLNRQSSKLSNKFVIPFPNKLESPKRSVDKIATSKRTSIRRGSKEGLKRKKSSQLRRNTSSILDLKVSNKVPKNYKLKNKKPSKILNDMIKKKKRNTSSLMKSKNYQDAMLGTLNSRGSPRNIQNSQLSSQKAKLRKSSIKKNLEKARKKIKNMVNGDKDYFSSLKRKLSFNDIEESNNDKKQLLDKIEERLLQKTSKNFHLKKINLKTNKILTSTLKGNKENNSKKQKLLTERK